VGAGVSAHRPFLRASFTAEHSHLDMGVPPATRRPRQAIWRWTLRSLGLVAGLSLLWLLAVWSPPIWYRWTWPRETAFMALRRGQAPQLAKHPQLRAEVRRGARTARRYLPVLLSEIAPAMRTAALVAEDHRFYAHGGVDYEAIRRAMGYRRDEFTWSNPRDRAELRRAVSRAWTRRDRIRGASTITQQLAKNLYLSPSRNPLRKLKEALTAYRLEWALGKERLLELYPNLVEFGPEIWGVEAASRVYFNRPARQLTTEQAAALAATLPFPLQSNPAYRPSRMRWRQDLILRRLRGEPVVIPPDTVTELAPLPPLDSLPPNPVDTPPIPPPPDTSRDTTRARNP